MNKNLDCITINFYYNINSFLILKYVGVFKNLFAAHLIYKMLSTNNLIIKISDLLNNHIYGVFIY